MMKINTILHPTDFSERSKLAFRMACSLAYDHGARLVVVNVVEPPAVAYGSMITHRIQDDHLEAARKQMAALKPTEESIGFATEILEGDPAERILEATRHHGADLIVMGTHGRTGLARVIMGSIAEDVLRRAECPVVVVKHKTPASDSPGVSHRVHAKT